MLLLEYAYSRVAMHSTRIHIAHIAVCSGGKLAVRAHRAAAAAAGSRVRKEPGAVRHLLPPGPGPPEIIYHRNTQAPHSIFHPHPPHRETAASHVQQAPEGTGPQEVHGQEAEAEPQRPEEGGGHPEGVRRLPERGSGGGRGRDRRGERHGDGRAEGLVDRAVRDAGADAVVVVTAGRRAAQRGAGVGNKHRRNNCLRWIFYLCLYNY